MNFSEENDFELVLSYLNTVLAGNFIEKNYTLPV